MVRIAGRVAEVLLLFLPLAARGRDITLDSARRMFDAPTWIMP